MLRFVILGCLLVVFLAICDYITIKDKRSIFYKKKEKNLWREKKSKN